MALKPTIYKFNINLSDLDRHYYNTLALTVAQHPSENNERMMARVLAFCFEAEEGLTFTKGLSTPDEPDVWARSLDDQLLHWLDVGEPSFERIKKASRQAQRTTVYSFNTKSDVWWQLESKAFSGLQVTVYQFPFEQIESLTEHLDRTLDVTITISEGTAFCSLESGDVEVPRAVLQSHESL